MPKTETELLQDAISIIFDVENVYFDMSDRAKHIYKNERDNFRQRMIDFLDDISKYQEENQKSNLTND